MKDLVHEPNAGRLEWVLIRKLDMDLPHATSKWSYTTQRTHGQKTRSVHPF